MKINNINIAVPHIQKKTNKKQIVLHWTAGGDSAINTANFWKSQNNNVATHYIIERSGAIYQCFNENYWAYHTGTKRAIDEQSIGIECCGYGGLAKINGKFYSWTGQEIPSSEVCTLEKQYKTLAKSTFFDKHKVSFARAFHYHKMTDAQIESMDHLIRLMNNKFSIPLEYQGDKMFYKMDKALRGEAGIFVHGSFRDDKSDIHPQPNFIEMLKNLK